MASVAEDRLLELLKTALQNTPVDTSRLRLCRKTRDLAHGDFVVPRGVLDIDLQSEVSNRSLSLTHIHSDTRVCVCVCVCVTVCVLLLLW